MSAWLNVKKRWEWRLMLLVTNNPVSRPINRWAGRVAEEKLREILGENDDDAPLVCSIAFDRQTPEHVDSDEVGADLSEKVTRIVVDDLERMGPIASCLSRVNVHLER